MGHEHSAEGGHAHSAGSRNKNRLALVLALTGSYMVVEIIGGLLSHSLALLAEAAHMFTDVTALALAFFAIRFAERPPTPERTYGYHRVEILAALANAAFLIALSGLIAVQGKAMFLVATLSAHAGVAEGVSTTGVLEALRQCVATQFKITHVTVQLEEAECGDSDTHA